MSKTVRTVIKTAGAGRRESVRQRLLLNYNHGRKARGFWENQPDRKIMNRETRGTREREKAKTDLTAKNTENAKNSGNINRR